MFRVDSVRRLLPPGHEGVTRLKRWGLPAIGEGITLQNSLGRKGEGRRREKRGRGR